MRTFRMSFSLALLSLSSSSGAVASSLCDQVQNNLVTNCGFETGDFTGWTLSGNTGNRGGYYYGVDAIDAFSGNYGAYLGPFGAPLDLGENLVTHRWEPSTQSASGLIRIHFRHRATRMTSAHPSAVRHC